MKIRLLRRSDIARASEIAGEDFTSRYRRTSAKEMRAQFDNKIIPPKYIIAEEKGEVVGFGGYIQSWMDYHVYNIFWISVAPEWQRKGIGTKIVHRIVSDIKARRGSDKIASMILLTTDKPAFYSKKFGFKTLTRFRRNRHSLMALKLD